MPIPSLITKIDQQDPDNNISFIRVGDHYESELCTIQLQTTARNFNSINYKTILKVSDLLRNYIQISMDGQVKLSFTNDLGSLTNGVTKSYNFTFKIVTNSLQNVQAILAGNIILNIETCKYDTATITILDFDTVKWITI